MRPTPQELREAYHIIERERFWSKVAFEGPLHPVLKTRCWLWEGAHQQGREYGVFRFRGTNMPAGKVALILSGNEIIDNTLICHHCDNPPCMRPDHLFQGSDKENAEDMVMKGRSSFGAKHYRAVLNDDLVRTLIREHLEGATGKALAKKYGISTSTVSAILTGKIWAHITQGQTTSRGKGGENAHAAKLTDALVRQLRLKWARGSMNISQTANELGITRATLYSALQGRTWSHIK